MAKREAQTRKAPSASGVGALVLVLAALAPAAAGADTTTAPAAPPEVNASLSASRVTSGASVAVAGRVSQAGRPLAGAGVELQADPYPFAGFTTVARALSGPDGSFVFAALRPDRDTRLRVVLEASSAVASPQLTIAVEPVVAINASSLGEGKTRLSIRLTHTPQAGSFPASAEWFVARRGSDAFRLAAVTQTRELAPGLTYASATIDPPSSRFIYRVCLRPAWQRAMGRPLTALRCPQSGAGAVVYGGLGSGIPLIAYPSAAAIAAAVRYLDARAGRTSLAVVNSAGELSGVHLQEHFETASVVKVMMLVAFLQMRSAEHRGLDEADRSLLYPMIHISDNEAASAVYDIVGEPAVARVARESSMDDYAPGVGWWAYTQTSAADQARFFFSLPHLIPAQFYSYARGLLSGIEPSQSWGVPPVARPRWQVFFKTGALPEEGLFNEVARLELGEQTFTVAVFTDGDPSMAYGEQTIEGVAAALLAHSP